MSLEIKYPKVSADPRSPVIACEFLNFGMDRRNFTRIRVWNHLTHRENTSVSTLVRQTQNNNNNNKEMKKKYKQIKIKMRILCASSSMPKIHFLRNLHRHFGAKRPCPSPPKPLLIFIKDFALFWFVFFLFANNKCLCGSVFRFNMCFAGLLFAFLLAALGCFLL